MVDLNALLFGEGKVSLEEWNKLSIEQQSEQISAVQDTFQQLSANPELKAMVSPEALKQANYIFEIAMQHESERERILYYRETGREPPRTDDLSGKPLEFDTMDRLMLKNTAKDPETAMQFMRGTPEGRDYDFVNYNGHIMAQNKKTKEWRPAIDPKGLGSGGWWDKTKEAMMDVTDVAGDLLQGGAEAAASAYLGARGAVQGLKGGAPGAFAGAQTGGAIGAGTAAAAGQTAKTWLGQQAGLQQEPTMAEALEAGKGGVLSNFLFGTGAGTKQIRKALSPAKQAKVMHRTGLTEKELLQRLTEAQSPMPAQIIRGGAERSLGTLGSSPETGFFSGIRDLKVLKAFRKEYTEAMKKGSLQAADEAREKALLAVAAQKRALRDTLSNAFREAGDEVFVDAKAIRMKADRFIQAAEDAAFTPHQRRVVEDLRRKIYSHMPKEPDIPGEKLLSAEGIPVILEGSKGDFIDKITLEQAEILKNNINAQSQGYLSQIKNSFKGGPPVDLRTKNLSVKLDIAARKASKEIEEQIDNRIKKSASGNPAYREFLDGWRETSNAERILTKGTPESWSNKFLRAESDKVPQEQFQRGLKQVDASLGTNLADEQIGAAMARKYDPATLPVSKAQGGNMSQFGKKTLGGTIGAIGGGAAGYGLSTALGLTPGALSMLGGATGGALGVATASPATMRWLATTSHGLGAPGRMGQGSATGRGVRHGIQAAGRAGLGNIEELSLNQYGPRRAEGQPVGSEVPFYQYSPYFNLDRYQTLQGGR